MGPTGAGMGREVAAEGSPEHLVARVKASDGSEIANTQVFIERPCIAPGLEPPEFGNAHDHFNDHVFERRVTFRHPDGSTSSGRIDLCKRGCFVLESKQSSPALRARPRRGGSRRRRRMTAL